jgi:hypothetical protein
LPNARAGDSKVSDTTIVRGGQVRYVEVSDTSSTCRQHLNLRVL